MRALALILLVGCRDASADTVALDAGCAPAEESAPAHDTLTLTAAKFADLPGWADDHFAEAMPSFLISCKKLGELHDDDPVGVDGHGGKARQWRHACAAAAKVKP